MLCQTNHRILHILKQEAGIGGKIVTDLCIYGVVSNGGWVATCAIHKLRIVTSTKTDRCLSSLAFFRFWPVS